MNVVTIGRNSNSGLPPGTYATTFFLRAPYNPNDTNPMSNQTAQFCRQCHADKSNEMNGSTAGRVLAFTPGALRTAAAGIVPSGLWATW